jgi:hypothetical protein
MQGSSLLERGPTDTITVRDTNALVAHDRFMVASYVGNHQTTFKPLHVFFHGGNDNSATTCERFRRCCMLFFSSYHSESYNVDAVFWNEQGQQLYFAKLDVDGTEVEDYFSMQDSQVVSDLLGNIARVCKEKSIGMLTEGMFVEETYDPEDYDPEQRKDQIELLAKDICIFEIIICPAVTEFDAYRHALTPRLGLVCDASNHGVVVQFVTAATNTTILRYGRTAIHTTQRGGGGGIPMAAAAASASDDEEDGVLLKRTLLVKCKGEMYDDRVRTMIQHINSDKLTTRLFQELYRLLEKYASPSVRQRYIKQYDILIAIDRLINTFLFF